MITLLASIAGFVSSIIPELIKFILDKNDKKHELEILKYQIQMHEKNLNGKFEQIDNLNYLAANKALYATYKTGISWVDALNGTVRPVLAYSFFFIYCFTKLLQYELLKDSSAVAIELLWTSEDQAIFAGVISFYYGQRAIAKLRKK